MASMKKRVRMRVFAPGKAYSIRTEWGRNMIRKHLSDDVDVDAIRMTGGVLVVIDVNDAMIGIFYVIITIP